MQESGSQPSVGEDLKTGWEREKTVWRRMCSPGRAGVIFFSGYGLKENLLGKRDQAGELEQGEGGGCGTLRVCVGCSKGTKKREFCRDNGVEMGTFQGQTEEKRQSRKLRI